MCYDDESNLQQFFLKFEGILSELAAINVSVEVEDQICYLLSSLPKIYDQLITSIETMGSEKQLNIEFVKARLLDMETKLKMDRNSEGYENNAFITCHSCGKRGHKSFECRSGRGQAPSRGQSLTRGRSYPRSCGRSFRGNSSSRHTTYQHASAAGTENKEIGFIASDIIANVGECGNIELIIDSGCTEHLINEKYENYMTDITYLDKHVKIFVANGQCITTSKRGKLKVKYQNTTINIDALIVKDVSYNLLSVKKIVEAGFNINFNKYNVKIFNKKTFLRGIVQGKLYKLQAELCKSEVCNITDATDLWHKRLGHLNRKSLNILNLPVSNRICSPCMEGKATRSPFTPIPKPRTKMTAEMLHTDIAGPIRHQGPNGEKYFMKIIDDFSHFCVVYPLKSKSEATERLMNYVLRIENETGNKVKRIRCDNGGEYTANSLKLFCINRGISLEYTLPYTPQLNGISERMNRTLCDKTRTLLAETNLPKHLWCEAIQCAVYQLNRSPSWAISFKTPSGIFFGKNDISRLRVFGSKAWATIVPKPDKFAKRAKETRMVGYGTVGYRLWDPEEDKIVISRDVRFDESDIKFKNKEEVKQVRYIQDKEEEINKEKQDIVEQEDEFKDAEMNTDQIEEAIIRPKRTINPPAYLKDYETNIENINETNIVICLSANAPETFEEAIKEPEWKNAINKELDALQRLETWEEQEITDGRKLIDTKWIFKLKEDGTKKARLVARGFQQKKKDIFDSVYAPVARHSTIRMILSKAVQDDLKIIQLDIPTAFLNGKLKSDVFIKIPQGLEIKNNNTALKLKRALYGLIESPKCWNETLDEFAKANGFQRSEYDYCLYYKEDCWMLIYVDDT